MATAIASLTTAQREFAEVHAVGLVEGSFAVGNVFMYHDDVAFTDRWLVRSDGSTAEHNRFERRIQRAG
jgi:hypothetical protein